MEKFKWNRHPEKWDFSDQKVFWSHARYRKSVNLGGLGGLGVLGGLEGLEGKWGLVGLEGLEGKGGLGGLEGPKGKGALVVQENKVLEQLY